MPPPISSHRWRARTVVDLAPHLAGWNPEVAWGVDTAGAVYACARRSAEPRYRKTQGASFAKSQWDGSSEHLLLRWADGEVRTAILRDEPTAIDYIQPLGNALLLLGARCSWRREGPERNALIVDWSGNVGHRFTLGDGIQDMRTAPDRSIWVSYFDEGVFGNYGWGSPGPEPIGSAGLAWFTADGVRAGAYDWTAAGTDSICDCYALNVAASGEVAVQFYTEFPIVTIRDGRYRAWRSEVAGQALALAAGRALVLEAYGKTLAAQVLTLRNDGTTSTEVTGVLVDEEDAVLGRLPARGVGDRLYLLAGTLVMVVDNW
jgi:hypothetical protein